MNAVYIVVRRIRHEPVSTIRVYADRESAVAYAHSRQNEYYPEDISWITFEVEEWALN